MSLPVLTEPEALRLTLDFDSIPASEQTAARDRLSAYKAARNGGPMFPEYEARRQQFHSATESLWLDDDATWSKASGQAPHWRDAQERTDYARLSYMVTQGADINRMQKGGLGGMRLKLAEAWGVPAVATDDAAFDGEIKKRIQHGRDERYLLQGPPGDDVSQEDLSPNMSGSQAEGALAKPLLPAAAEAALSGVPLTKVLAEWQRTAARKPGFSAERIGEYERQARAVHDEMRMRGESVLPAVQELLAAYTSAYSNDPGGYGADKIVDILEKVPAENRPIALALLQRAAAKIGAAKPNEAQGKVAFGRGLFDIVHGVNRKELSKLLQDADEYLAARKPGEAIGGATVNDARNIGKLTLLEGMDEGGTITQEKIDAAKQSIARQWDRLGMTLQLEQIGNASFDPLKGGGFFTDKMYHPFMQGIAPQLAIAALTRKIVPPGAAALGKAAKLGGAVVNAAPAIYAMHGLMADQNAQQLIAQNPEMPVSQAYSLGRHAAVYQSGLEYAQMMLGLGVVGKGKALGQQLLSMQGSAWKTFGKAIGLGILEQNLIEGVQDITAQVVQALTKDAPAVPWPKVFNGPGGYWAQRLDTFWVVLPLAVFSAGGQAMRSKATAKDLTRVATSMTDTVLHAAGIQADTRAAILAETDAAKRLDAFSAALPNADKATADEGAARLQKERAAAQGKFSEEMQRVGVTLERGMVDGTPAFRVSGPEGVVTNHATIADAMSAVTSHLDAEFVKTNQPALDMLAALAASESELNREAGIREIRRGDAGWYLVTEDGTRIQTGTAEAALHMRESLRLASTQNEADAMIAESEAIAAANAAEGVGSVQTFKKAVRRVAKDGETMAGDLPKSPQAIAELRAEMEAAGLDEAIIRGSNYTVADDAGRLIRHYETNAGGDITTILHERFETVLKSGAVSSSDLFLAANELAALPAFDPAKIKDKGARRIATSLRRIAMDETMSDAEKRETIIELAVADRLGQFRDGEAIQPGSIQSAVRDAAMHAAPGPKRRALESFARLLAVVRRYLRAMFSLAKGIREARESGALKKGEAWDKLMDKLAGVDIQKKHNEAVLKEAGVDETFSIAPADSTPPGGLTGGELGALREDSLEPSYTGRIFNDASETENTPDTSSGTESSGGEVSDAEGKTQGGTQKQDAPERSGRGLKEQAVARLDAAQHNRRIAGDWFAARRAQMLDPVNGRPLAAPVKLWLEETAERIENALRDGWASRKMLTDIRPPLYYQKSRQITTEHDREVAEEAGTRMEKILAPLVEDLGFTLRQEVSVNSGQKVTTEDSAITFSLGSADTLEHIAARLDAMKGDPKERLSAYERAAEDLRGMARAVKHNASVADALTAREVDKERAARREKREDELLEEVDRDFGDLSGTEFIASALNNPVMDAIFTQKPGQTFPRSMIQSRSRAERRGRDAGGSYDGSGDLPRWIFGGSIEPDVMAQQLFDDGLLKEPSPDALWNAIASALKTAGAAKDRLSDYGQRRAAARVQATKEAEQWADEQLADLPARQKEGARAAMLRGLVALDAILMKFPAAVRAKVGGFIKLASLQTEKAREAFLVDRIEKLDREVEKFLKGEYRSRLDILIERGQPNAKPGEKSKGKIGPEAHRFFAEVQSVAGMSAAEVEARQTALDAQLSAPDLTDDQAADIFEKQQIADTFGNLDGKNSAELAAALKLADEVYTRGRNKWRIQEEIRLAGVRELAQGVVDALGKGTYSGTQGKKGVARRAGEKLKGVNMELQNFAGFMRGLLGDDHPLAKKWGDAARAGYAFSEDQRRGLRKEWDAAVKKATGKKGRAGRLAVWNMANEQTLNITLAGESTGKTETVPSSVVEKLADGITKPEALGFTQEEADTLIEKMAGGKPLTIRRTARGAAESVKMTEAEGIFVTMLFHQEQYADALDAAGFTAEAVQSIEYALSDGAKLLREFLRNKYRDGYAPLNSIFARMFGVDLPQIENYAPAAFYHTGDEKAKGPDDTIPEGGFRANFLKNRKRHTAAPRLENAFASFFGHQAQMSHWQGFAELVREMRGVIGRPEVKRSIEAAHGKETLNLLNDWVKALEGNGIQKAHGAWESFTGWLLKQAAYIQLGWKVGTLAVQSTAALGSAYRIPAGAYFRGMGRLLSGELDLKAMWASPLIQNRLENGFAPEVRAALHDMWGAKPSRRQDFLEKGMELIGFVDAVFTTASAAIAWDYHYNAALKAGMIEAQARETADSTTAEIVSETAQPATVPNRSLFELKQGNLGKLAFLYASEARQKAALLLNAWGKTFTGKATAQDVQVLIIAHLVIGPLIQAIRNAWWDARDDDDDELFDAKHWQAGGWLKAMAMGPLSGVPLLNDVVSSFDDSNAAVGRFKDAGENAVKIFEGPAKGNKEPVEFYWNRVVKILQGLDAATATGAGVADQVFKVTDNLTGD